MSAEILINVRPLETRVAYVESGVLMDLKIERKTSPTLVGTIHRGVVTRVLPGMQAAFVDIGIDQDGLVHISELAAKRVAKVGDVVKEGEMVKVKLIGIDDRGKVRLSMKVVDQATGKEIAPEKSEPPAAQ